MGVLKYDVQMSERVLFRVTSAQANSLKAEADMTSLSVCDVVRAAVDGYFEDLDGLRIFTRQLPYIVVSSPARRR
jgi:hypothetical protein